MKNIIIALIIIFTLNISVFAQEKYTGQTIEDIFNLSEDEIDLGIACLIIAKIAHPDLNISRYDLLLLQMANRIRAFSKYSSEPLVRIGAMNTYLYRKGWWNNYTNFTYDIDDLELKKKENHFINYYLDTRKGSCITMPMLCVILADRMDWPIKAVLAPKHFFCRYVDDVFKEGNIDATIGGGYIPDEQYIKDAKIPEKDLKNNVYMNSMSKKQFLAALLMNLGVYKFEVENDLEKAMYYTGLALVNDSTLSDAHWNLHRFYNHKGNIIKSNLDQEISRLTHLHNIEIANLNSNRTNPYNPMNNPEYRQYSKSNPQRPLDRNQIILNKRSFQQLEIEEVKRKYVPIINECYQRSLWHKQKTEELGIVFELTREFYIKQEKSIEKFKQTGEY